MTLLDLEGSIVDGCGRPEGSLAGRKMETKLDQASHRYPRRN